MRGADPELIHKIRRMDGMDPGGLLVGQASTHTIATRQARGGQFGRRTGHGCPLIDIYKRPGRPTKAELARVAASMIAARAR